MTGVFFLPCRKRASGFRVKATRLPTQDPDGITELVWPEGPSGLVNWPGWEEEKEAQCLDESNQTDLVHAGPIQGPALLTALSGFHPIVTMSWGSDLLRTAQRSPWMHWATQFTLDRTDVFVADCQTVADEAAQVRLPQDENGAVPLGRGPDAFFHLSGGRQTGRALRKALGWEKKFVVLCNRTWVPVYGVDVLAEGFKRAVLENSQPSDCFWREMARMQKDSNDSGSR